MQFYLKAAIIFFSKLIGHFRFLPSDARSHDGHMQYFCSMHWELLYTTIKKKLSILEHVTNRECIHLCFDNDFHLACSKRVTLFHRHPGN